MTIVRGHSDPLILRGRVESGKGDAGRWLAKFNAVYARKMGLPVFPGSLNLALDIPFDWSAPMTCSPRNRAA